jgi:hypothetical protein
VHVCVECDFCDFVMRVKRGRGLCGVRSCILSEEEIFLLLSVLLVAMKKVLLITFLSDLILILHQHITQQLLSILQQKSMRL